MPSSTTTARVASVQWGWTVWIAPAWRWGRRLAVGGDATPATLPPVAASAHNLAALAADDAAVARSGTPATAERWLSVPPDHHRALFEVVTTPMHYAQGQPAGVLGIARDITLIKQGAQALAYQSRLVDNMFSFML